MIENKLNIHHVSVACHDIELAKAFYPALGYEASEIVIDPMQNVKICFLNMVSLPHIVLLSPVDESSPINLMLEASGVTPNHFCYESFDITSAVTELQERHFIPLSKSQSTCANGNRRVSFRFKEESGLIGLVEK